MGAYPRSPEGVLKAMADTTRSMERTLKDLTMQLETERAAHMVALRRADERFKEGLIEGYKRGLAAAGKGGAE